MILNVMVAGRKDEHYSLLIYTNSGSTVTVTNGKDTYTKIANSKGIAAFCVYEDVWTVTCTKGNLTETSTITVSGDAMVDYSYNMWINTIPEFTYNGIYEIVNDTNNEVNSSQDNWNVRLLTSGKLKFTELNGAANGIEVFLCGGGGSGGYSGSYGGGGGGAGGHTVTQTINIESNKEYQIIIGGSNGATSGFNLIASPGSQGGVGSDSSGSMAPGGSSGTGKGGAGGTVISRGSEDWGEYSGRSGSKGVTAFNSGTGIFYGAGGGGGIGAVNPDGTGAGDGRAGGAGGISGGGRGAHDLYGNGGAGIANTGGGGGGAGAGHNDNAGWGGAGGSGIVIIRNKRG